MNKLIDLDAEANAFLAGQAAALRQLSYAKAVALPEAAGDEATLAGRRCSVTVFRQLLEQGHCMVVVQVATPNCLGLASLHLEQGLVFEPGGQVRDATADELADTGG